jgi:hypothetical protein
VDADPWCVGVFVGNELPWSAVGSDSVARVASTFYRILSEEFRKAIPHKLYLCDRNTSASNTVFDTASKYCDVVSGNRYTYAPTGPFLPKSSRDKPFLIGEFHFGSMAEGTFGTGLSAAAGQKSKAQAMEAYYRQVLSDSNVVGAHWFTYRDQMASGRKNNGENSGIGFVDIADRPYPEMAGAARRIGLRMYGSRRSGGWSTPPTRGTPAQRSAPSVTVKRDSRGLLLQTTMDQPCLGFVLTTVDGRILSRRDRQIPEELLIPFPSGSPSLLVLSLTFEGERRRILVPVRL